jgi:hypothetical protein
MPSRWIFVVAELSSPSKRIPSGLSWDATLGLCLPWLALAAGYVHREIDERRDPGLLERHLWRTEDLDLSVSHTYNHSQYLHPPLPKEKKKNDGRISLPVENNNEVVAHRQIIEYAAYGVEW